MKSLILVLSCLMMSGCFYQTVNRYDVDEAEIICAKKASHIVEIKSIFNTDETVTCADNSMTYPVMILIGLVIGIILFMSIGSSLIFYTLKEWGLLVILICLWVLVFYKIRGVLPTGDNLCQ